MVYIRGVMLHPSMRGCLATIRNDRNDNYQSRLATGGGCSRGFMPTVGGLVAHLGWHNALNPGVWGKAPSQPTPSGSCRIHSKTPADGAAKVIVVRSGS